LYAPSDELVDEDNSIMFVYNGVLEIVVVDVQVSHDLSELFGEFRFDLERRAINEDDSLKECSTKITIALIKISYKFNIPEFSVPLVV